MTCHRGPKAAEEGGLIPEEEEMPIPQDGGRIPGCNHQPRYHLHRPHEGQGYYGLADTNEGQGSASLSQPNELLPMIHMELLWSVTRTDRLTQKRHQIRVDKGGRGILYGIEASFFSGRLSSPI